MFGFFLCHCYREGLVSADGFMSLRLDPFDEDIRGAIGETSSALQDCAFVGSDEVANILKKTAKEGGSSLSLLCHNIRSAKGPGLELLEAEMRRMNITWDVVGLTETWLDKESEERVSVKIYLHLERGKVGEVLGCL